MTRSASACHLICDAATEVPDLRKHRWVRIGSELIPIGLDHVRIAAIAR